MLFFHPHWVRSLLALCTDEPYRFFFLVRLFISLTDFYWASPPVPNEFYLVLPSLPGSSLPPSRSYPLPGCTEFLFPSVMEFLLGGHPALMSFPWVFPNLIQFYLMNAFEWIVFPAPSLLASRRVLIGCFFLPSFDWASWFSSAHPMEWTGRWRRRRRRRRRRWWWWFQREKGWQ